MAGRSRQLRPARSAGGGGRVGGPGAGCGVRRAFSCPSRPPSRDLLAARGPGSSPGREFLTWGGGVNPALHLARKLGHKAADESTTDRRTAPCTTSARSARTRHSSTPPWQGAAWRTPRRRSCNSTRRAARASMPPRPRRRSRIAPRKEVGAAKARGDEAEFERLRAKVTEKKVEVAAMQAEARELDARLNDLLMGLPNLPLDDVPDGDDEADNVEMRRWGEPRAFDFPPREHYEIEGVKPGMDFETAATLSGSRFVVHVGGHRAPPSGTGAVHDRRACRGERPAGDMDAGAGARRDDDGTGQLPEVRRGQLPDDERLVAGAHGGGDADQPRPRPDRGRGKPAAAPCRAYAMLPLRGRQRRQATPPGMLRQHQFEKVEMVSITHPDRSREELDRMTGCAQGSSSGSACPTARWCCAPATWGSARGAPTTSRSGCPGRACIARSSVSVCGEFQARRMNARFRPAEGGKPQFVHTLNGSGPRGGALPDRGAGERAAGGRLGRLAGGAAPLAARPDTPDAGRGAGLSAGRRASGRVCIPGIPHRGCRTGYVTGRVSLLCAPRPHFGRRDRDFFLSCQGSAGPRPGHVPARVPEGPV